METELGKNVWPPADGDISGRCFLLSGRQALAVQRLEELVVRLRKVVVG